MEDIEEIYLSALSRYPTEREEGNNEGIAERSESSERRGGLGCVERVEQQGVFCLFESMRLDERALIGLQVAVIRGTAEDLASAFGFAQILRRHLRMTNCRGFSYRERVINREVSPLISARLLLHLGTAGPEGENIQAIGRSTHLRKGMPGDATDSKEAEGWLGRENAGGRFLPGGGQRGGDMLIGTGSAREEFAGEQIERRERRRPFMRRRRRRRSLADAERSRC